MIRIVISPAILPLRQVEGFSWLVWCWGHSSCWWAGYRISWAV